MRHRRLDPNAWSGRPADADGPANASAASARKKYIRSNLKPVLLACAAAFLAVGTLSPRKTAGSRDRGDATRNSGAIRPPPRRARPNRSPPRRPREKSPEIRRLRNASSAPARSGGSRRNESPLPAPPPPPYRELWEIEVLRNASAPPLTACACAKCGSTSFFLTMYEIAHGTEWNFTGRPWVHVPDSPRWSNVRARRVGDDDDRRGATRSGNSVALIRDPRERLLSAWRSKVACDAPNVDDRRKFVPHLLRLAGTTATTDAAARVPPNGDPGNLDDPCLDLPAYVGALHAIHARGRAGEINTHFLPQHMACFRDDPPSEWTVVATADSPDLVCRLRELLLGVPVPSNATASGDGCAMKRSHGTNRNRAKSSSTYEDLPATSKAMLDAITREEYDVLGPYLNGGHVDS